MMEFVSACARLFSMTFNAAFGLDYFKYISYLLVLQAGIVLLRLGFLSTRKM